MTVPMQIDEPLARLWCQSLAQRSQMAVIMRNNLPYLERFYVAGWNPMNRQSGPAVFLHHFVASDAHDAVHSHPWGWSTSLILVGGYREERCTGVGTSVVKEYRPGDVNVLTPHDKHRIDLLAVDCWTLFLAGEYAQAWQFTPTC